MYGRHALTDVVQRPRTALDVESGRLNFRTLGLGIAVTVGLSYGNKDLLTAKKSLASNF